ncbi:putative baseplate assembly protein [Desulfosporosinus sp. OT]|uniref:putative baseplate assembly protein n=1 Tax=Desulfosporosinus sp. OT TaxID=913865 RepID=UPI000223B2FC|nr:putative baseplate assembly protein [Desulfosporosinus sp. OT]EGW36024.1 hypothetical protein DOT_6081 [Desulfosporosinus sp. OT]
MLPLPVLDDKSFREIVEDALKLIPRFTPEWTDYNPHDPGMTFIELFAWLVEMQHYYMDQVGEQNYLKFLRLLGIRPKEAVPAKVDVTFSLPEEYAAASPLVVPQGTKLLAGEVIFETLETISLNKAELVKILTAAGNFSDNTETNRRLGLYYYAFGEKAAQGSRLYLGFDNSPAELTLTVNLFEDYPEEGSHYGEQPEIIPTARVSWEYGYREIGWSVSGETGDWWPLNLVKDETLGLFRSGRVYLAMPDSKLQQEKINFWLRCTVVQDGYEIPPKIHNILYNTIGAVQQETLSSGDNPLLLTYGSGLPGQKIILRRTPVISSTFALQVEERNREGNRMTLMWRDWQRVDDLDASEPDDRHYVLNSETGEVLFGDGVNGAVPSAPVRAGEKNIRVVTYQVGGGEKGNLKAGAVNKLLCSPDSELAHLLVENQLPAVGGAEPETLEQAKAQARRELNTISRAVTFDDFEKLACMTPGLRVARAKAFSQGKEGVKVVVVPYSQAPNPTPGEGFLETVRRHLDMHRLVTTRVEVLPPQYTVVNIYASVGVKPRYDPETTREQILAGLENFLHPVWGGPEEAGWPFGRRVYKSELYQLIQNIEGVDYVKELEVTSPEEGDQLKNQVEQLRLVYLGERRVDILSPGRTEKGAVW